MSIVRTASGDVGPPPTGKDLAMSLYHMLLDDYSWNAATDHHSEQPDLSSHHVAPMVGDMVDDVSLSSVCINSEDDNTTAAPAVSCPSIDSCDSSTDIASWMDDCTVAITGPRGSGTTRTMIDLLYRRALLWKEYKRTYQNARNRQNLDKVLLSETTSSSLQNEDDTISRPCDHTFSTTTTVTDTMPSKLYDYGLVVFDDDSRCSTGHGSLNPHMTSQLKTSLSTLCRHFDIIHVRDHIQTNKEDGAADNGTSYRRQLLDHMCSTYTHVATVCQRTPRVLWVFDSADAWQMFRESALLESRKTQYPRVTLIVTTHQYNNPVVSQYCDTILFCAAPFLIHQGDGSSSSSSSAENNMVHQALMNYATWYIRYHQDLLRCSHATSNESTASRWLSEWKTMIQAQQKNNIIQPLLLQPRLSKNVTTPPEASTPGEMSSAPTAATTPTWKAPMFYNLHPQTMKQIVGSTMDIGAVFFLPQVSYFFFLCVHDIDLWTNRSTYYLFLVFFSLM